MLTLRGVDFDIGANSLLRGVDLHVRPGHITAVVGPNGAGKTTLLRIASGDLVPTAGTVHLDGADVNTYRSANLALMRAVLPHATTLSFPFTVREVVRMGRHPHAVSPSEDNAQLAAAMESADVAGLADRISTTLSAGEQRRVAFARMLCQNTPLVLLDEPTAALDVTHQHRVMAVLRQRAATGGSVLAVLHDLNLASRYADDVAVLDRGSVVAAGAPARVLTAPRLSAVYGHPMTVIPHPELDHPLVLPC
ncbi:MAG: heme ABC transporter ATP-binding protein [Acidimicrobiia bacterium]